MKKTTPFLLKTISAAAPLICCSFHAQALNVFGPTNGDWSTAANWSLGVLPDSGQSNVIIQDGRTANLNGNFTSASGAFLLLVRDNNPDGVDAKLNITADLATLSSFLVGANNGQWGVVNHSAGTVTNTGATTIGMIPDVNPVNPSVYNLSGSGVLTGTNVETQYDAELNIRGGSVNTTEMNVAHGGRVNIIDGAANVDILRVRSTGGTVRHISGTLNTNSITLDAGACHQCGGVVDNAGPLTIASGASYHLSGGTYDNTEAGNNTLVTGSGTLEISGGILSAAGTAATDTVYLNGVTANISGGTVELNGGQVLFSNSPTINVTGDASSVRMDRLNAGSANLAVTFNLELGRSGITPVTSSAWMNLEYASITVDGSAYTSPVGEIDLFTSTNLASHNLANLTITGFPGHNAVANVRTLLQAEVTDFQCVADVAGSLNGTYFDLTGASGTQRFWYNVDNTGSAPADPGAGVHEIHITAGASADVVASAAQAVVDAQPDFGATVNTNTVTVTDASDGSRDNAVDSGGTGFTITVVTQGAALDQDIYLTLTPDVGDIDSDGLTNYDEVVIHHTDPTLADSDHDGVSDGDEIAAGSDPSVDNTPVIGLALDSLKSLGGLAVSQLTPSGPNYLLTLKMEESENLHDYTDLDLTVINTVVDEQADTITFTIDGSAMKKFVRLKGP